MKVQSMIVKDASFPREQLVSLRSLRGIACFLKDIDSQ